MRLQKEGFMVVSCVALWGIVAGLSLFAACPAQAQKPKKPPVKPASAPPGKQPIVLGTKQLPGDFGQIGTTYTIGNRGEELNFTLLSAEYSVGRKIMSPILGERYYVPPANQKLLVLRYTVQNPTPQDSRMFDQSFRFTAVSSKDTNHSDLMRVTRVTDEENVDFGLKPAQKVEVTTAVIVPAGGEIPKLIVQRGDGAVIRYDLRGKVKPLPAPFADPADKTGATPIATVNATLDTYYPFEAYDMKVTGVAYSNDNPEPDAPPAENGERFLVVTITFRGTKEARRLFDQSIQGRIKTEDGEEMERTGAFVRANRKATFDGTLDNGQEVPIRLVFRVPKEMKPKTLILNEPEHRRLSFDISNIAP
jgi:hypothetical protein